MYNIGWLGHGIQHFVVDGSVHLWNLTAGNRFQTIPNQFFEGPAFIFPIVHADFDDSWCFLLWFSYRVVCIQAPRPAGILIFVFSGTPRRLKSFPGNSLWPFWDGDPWPFRKVVGDLQRLGINRSRLESPGQYNFLFPCLHFSPKTFGGMPKRDPNTLPRNEWHLFSSHRPPFIESMKYHQEFQVPKMEVLNLIRLFWGCVFPYISLTYSLYRWVPPF